MILNESEKKVNVLLLHPQTTAWSLFDSDKNEGIAELNQKVLSVIKTLEHKHINFHLGDEIMIERHGKVEDGKFIIGKQSYDYVIDSCCEGIIIDDHCLC